MKDISFEKALEALESVVDKMEEGELSLEDSLKKYEEGVKLSKVCLKHLTEAEKKIELLKENADGNLETEDFSDNIDDEDSSSPRRSTSRKPAKKTSKNDNDTKEEDLFS